MATPPRTIRIIPDEGLVDRVVTDDSPDEYGMDAVPLASAAASCSNATLSSTVGGSCPAPPSLRRGSTQPPPTLMGGEGWSSSCPTSLALRVLPRDRLPNDPDPDAAPDGLDTLDMLWTAVRLSSSTSCGGGAFPPYMGCRPSAPAFGGDWWQYPILATSPDAPLFLGDDAAAGWEGAPKGTAPEGDIRAALFSAMAAGVSPPPQTFVC